MSRCAVIYAPSLNEAAATSFTYAYEYPSNPTTGNDNPALVSISVTAVNDAPNNDPQAQKALICRSNDGNGTSNGTSFTFIESADFCVLNTSVAEGGVEFSIKLNSYDLDGSPVQDVNDPFNVLRPYYQVREPEEKGTSRTGVVYRGSTGGLQGVYRGSTRGGLQGTRPELLGSWGGPASELAYE
eukprot:1134613-Pyramimonas_sp.AAC.1